MYKYKRLSLGKDEDGNRVFRDEHRKKMEDFLGKKLSRYEVVHHLNENKQDNRIENLQVMPLSEHSRMHHLGKKLSQETKNKMRIKAIHRPFVGRTKTREDIINIVLKYKELKSYRKVDRYFNFANGTTGAIVRGDQYYDYQELIKELLRK